MAHVGPQRHGGGKEQLGGKWALSGQFKGASKIKNHQVTDHAVLKTMRFFFLKLLYNIGLIMAVMAEAIIQ